MYIYPLSFNTFCFIKCIILKTGGQLQCDKIQNKNNSKDKEKTRKNNL